MRKKTILMDQDELKEPEKYPERRLFVEIVNRALEDARGANAYGIKSKTKHGEEATLAETVLIARDAMEFLLTDRCDPYLHLLDLDPTVFRESLVRTQHQECVLPPADYADVDETVETPRSARLASENKKRRLFRINYQYFKEFQEQQYLDYRKRGLL